MLVWFPTKKNPSIDSHLKPIIIKEKIPILHKKIFKNRGKGST